jgi:hypothetical protein
VVSQQEQPPQPPKGIAMNDYEIICKGIVIIGSLQSAVRS